MEKLWLNKLVRIYPNDTYKKCGIIKNISAQGITFLITESDEVKWKVGKMVFVSFSAKLSFVEADES